MPRARFCFRFARAYQDNLFSEEQPADSGAGTAVPNTGRISIVDPTSGAVRTLLDGLPSALNLVGEQPAPSGPSGLAMRERGLYVTIGSGNSTLRGPVPGSEIPNPNPSSPLFSSVLELHFSGEIEMRTKGIILSDRDRAALATGHTLTFRQSEDESSLFGLVNFPDYVAAPRPDFQANVASSLLTT
jgi:hypothetical protein